MKNPADVEGWVTRLEDISEEITAQQVAKAYKGSAEAKAIVQAWAVELHAAGLFIAAQAEAAGQGTDKLIETINAIIDTLQAILLALVIYFILTRIKKKGKGGVIHVNITRPQAVKIAGDKAKPIPSQPDDDDEAKQAAFLHLRLLWTAQYLHTLMKGLQLQQNRKPGQELEWVAHLDSKTCSICRKMHGKKSVNGDFLPVILKYFPKYKAFGAMMLYPHAHPRCRCSAKPV